jgi:hypothetical protein
MSRISCALLAFVGLALGCEELVTYSYYDVTVRLDPVSIDDDMLLKINSCAVVVEGLRQDTTDLVCVRGSIKHDLGHFNYSTSTKSGTVRFIVSLKDLRGREIAHGESVELGIVPNVTTPATILVTAVTDSPDAGAGVPDASSDAAGQ